jgi:putative pyruvate formate lyase activating enzyme
MTEDGRAAGGMLVRHLVLPGRVDETREVLAWLAGEFGPEVWISLMAQYKPLYRAAREPGLFPEIGRPLSEVDYDAAMDAALELGLENVFVQEMESSEAYLPDFRKPGVFTKD